MLTDVDRVAEPRGWIVRLAASDRRTTAAVWVGWAFVGLGCALRIREYVANRSLTIDESFLALNLLERSPRQLLDTLAFAQAAPVGFLEAQNAAVGAFGSSEFALRLLPLIASLLTVVLFYRVAQRAMQPVAAALAIAVFALLEPLIVYAATAKQYAFDVAGAVLILAVALDLEERPLRRRALVALGVIGAVLVWFSHAAAFGLAALGLLLLVRVVGTRNWALGASALAVIAAWIGSFAAQYALSRSGITGILSAFRQGSGEALEPVSSDSAWLSDAIDRMRYLVGLEDVSSGQPMLESFDPLINRGLTLLVLVVAVVGFISLCRRSRRLALVLALPPVLAGLASALGQYPLVGRTLLFAIPSLAICIGEGLAAALAASRPRPWRVVFAALAITCLTAIAVLPVAHAMRPRGSQEMKEALRYLGERSERGDVLYLSSGAQYAFGYYHLCACSEFDPATRWPFSSRLGPESSTAIQSRSPDLVVESGPLGSELAALLDRDRVWILLTEAWQEERDALVEYLRARGRLRERFDTDGPLPATASLYLFDFTPSAREKDLPG
jgi:hypothetical protein